MSTCSELSLHAIARQCAQRTPAKPRTTSAYATRTEAGITILSLSRRVAPKGSTALRGKRVSTTEVSDRYQLYLSIIYLKAVMIVTMARCRMQMHSTHAALVVRPPPPSSALAAVDTIALSGVYLWPVANERLVYSS